MNRVNGLTELLNSVCHPRVFEVPADGSIFIQGDPAGEIYLVLKGQVRLVRYTEQGAALTLFSAREGQTFAEAALFSPIYHCTAVADKACRILGFDKKELLAALEKNPSIMLRLVAMLSRQIKDMRTLLEIRSIPSASDRVMQYLLLQADSGSGVYTIPTTLKDLAQELGLAHETLYRVLAALEQKGRIRKKGRAIYLVD